MGKKNIDKHEIPTNTVQAIIWMACTHTKNFVILILSIVVLILVTYGTINISSCYHKEPVKFKQLLDKDGKAVKP